MEISDYVKLTNKIDKLNDENREFRKENHELRKGNCLLRDMLITYKQECEILHKELRDGRRKFYRNRKLFEELIDLVLLTIDEDLLKQATNLTYKTAKEAILKNYDEDIKYN